MSDSPALQTLLDSLHHPQLKEIDLSLGRMIAHLQAAGNPHLRLPPVVHVAGTNGKGSTIAFLRAMLEAAGYVCHVYTSPHLVHFRERIVVSGHEISDEALIPLLDTVKNRSHDYPLTFFEATTLAAFMAFAESPADFTLLEVGMGGQFDATNVVPNPALSIITPISLDHCEFLGNSLPEIAREKAAILKSGSYGVIAPQAPEAAQTISAMAESAGARLAWVEEGDIDAIANELLSLGGAHQYINAATAIMAAELLIRQGTAISREQMVQGLHSAHWPARMQRLTQGELVNLLPTGWQLWLDGGHNESAAQAIAQWARRHQPLHILCAMAKHKDAAAFLKPFKGLDGTLYLTEIPEQSEWAMPLAQLEQAAVAHGITYQANPDLKQAIQLILNNNKDTSGHVLCCGSLYLAGKILENNN